MPFTKEALTTAYNLSEEDVNRTLLASELSLEQPEYSDEDIQTRFERIRCYLKEGQAESYEAAMDLLKQELAAEANGKRKKSSKAKTKPSLEGEDTESVPLSREQLLEQIQSLIGQVGGLSLEETIEILPEVAQRRQAEIIEMFDRGMLKRLNEMATSGELEQMVRQMSVGKKSLAEIPSLFLELEAEVIEEPSLPPLLSESSSSKSSS